MSEITAPLAEQVLDLLVTHLLDELDDLVLVARRARAAQDEMSRAQASGPHAQPEEAQRAGDVLAAAVAALSLDVEDYATATDAKVAMV